MSYQLIAMDLDGTLTQHKSCLEEKNYNLLCELKKRYRLLMLGAGGCERIYKQMNEFPIDIVGNYGIQESRIIDGVFKIVRNDCYAIDIDFFEKTITKIRNLTGYTHYDGDNVEFHASGLVTFPLLGTKALLKDKLAFDPDGSKRTAIYDLVAGEFSDYNCFIGGTSSFDIPLKKYDKYQALLSYIHPIGISEREVLFIGDDFKKGGNDEQLLLAGIDCVQVTNYQYVSEMLHEKGIV